MQSPFPGMDPYLEDPTIWRSVHHHLIAAIGETLGDALAPAFYVAVEERVYIATPDDLLVIEPLEEEEIREAYLELRDVRTRAVITVIEVVSPTNKASGSTGRRHFQDKRRRVMASETHWLEIDLLRAGERPLEARGRSAYCTLLRRGVPGAPYELWVSGLRDRLPIIGVPTRAPLADTPLDLAEILQTVYRRGHYELAIDYDGQPPLPLLSTEDAQWAIERVAQWRGESR